MTTHEQPRPEREAVARAIVATCPELEESYILDIDLPAQLAAAAIATLAELRRPAVEAAVDAFEDVVARSVASPSAGHRDARIASRAALLRAAGITGEETT